MGTKKDNPKLQKWLDVGKRRFAHSGIEGININEISEEVGVAKTSFYYFFNSKEEFLDQLFAFWVLDGTDRLYAMVSEIKDPAKRFLTLSRLIEENTENEFFYFQLKLYAKDHPEARRFLDVVDRKRKAISVKLFRDAGQSDEQILKNRLQMRMLYMGNVALDMGYVTEPLSYRPSKEELLKLFGLNK